MSHGRDLVKRQEHGATVRGWRNGRSRSDGERVEERGSSAGTSSFTAAPASEHTHFHMRSTNPPWSRSRRSVSEVLFIAQLMRDLAAVRRCLGGALLACAVVAPHFLVLERVSVWKRHAGRW